MPEPTIVIDASSQAPLTLPSGQFASDAEFVQQGDDLLLIGADGLTVIVRDYFLSDPAPDLLTPEGGRLTQSIVESFTPPESVGQYAQAAESAATQVGQTTSIVGKVFVVRANGIRESIGAGDPIFQGDVIETAEGAAVDVIFIDKTTFALGGDARLAIDRLVFDPSTQEGSSSYSILKGMFVFSSGEIAKVNPLDMTLKTTVATIGIRGTTVAGEVKSAGEVSKFTILEGEIIVTTDAGFVILNEANETTFVTGFSAPPSDAVLFSDSEIDSFYSDVKTISDDYYRAQKTNQQGEINQNDDDLELNQLAEALNELAPAAGPEEGGNSNQAPLEPISLLRIDEKPFRTEAVQEFNLTENAGDEIGGSIDEGFAPPSSENGAGEDEGTLVSIATSDDDTGASQDEGDVSTGFNFNGASAGLAITGTEGDDTIFGGSGNDLLQGGGGNDIFLFFGTGNGFDLVSGGDGFDRIEGSAGDDVIGLARFSGELSVEQIDGGGGFDVIRGGKFLTVLDFSETTLLGISRIEGGSGRDTITGSSGNDTIAGEAGNDVLAGGAGNDVFLFEGTNTGLDLVSGGGGFDRIEGSDGDDVIGLARFSGELSVEQIDGGGGVDIIRGGDFLNVLDFSETALLGISRIEGGSGSDTITGSSGNDTIAGEAGNDVLAGGDGDDVFLFEGTNTGLDRVSGDGGFDRIEGSSGDDVIGLARFSGEQGVEQINGGGGVDVIRGGDFLTVLDFSETALLGISRIEGGSGSDTITGSSGNDTIAGEAGNDTLAGGDGDDVLIGGSGSDRLTGDEGDDRFIIENDNFALIDGGEGTDTVEVDFVLDLGNVNNSNLRGIESFDLGDGNNAALTIGLDDVLAATDGINALTESESTLVIRRNGNSEVEVVGDDWVTSEDTLDTDGDEIAESYTVFHDNASGANVYVENVT